MGTRGEAEEEEWRHETGANPEDQGCRGPPPEQQNVNYLRQCPSGIAQQIVYYAIAVPTAVRNRVTMSVAPPLGNNWSKRSPTFKPSSTYLLLISSGLTWGSGTTTLFLISPGLWLMLVLVVKVLLYVHRNRRLIRDGEPRTSTSAFTQLLSSDGSSLEIPSK